MEENVIILRYFDGCPNWQIAKARLDEALERLEAKRSVYLELVHTPEEAESLDFRGSPTILIDGRDPFVATGSAGLSCRIYRTPSGLEGAPSVDQLVAVLQEMS